MRPGLVSPVDFYLLRHCIRNPKAQQLLGKTKLHWISRKCPDQWCSKTTNLQDQDHLYFQDKTVQAKTKTTFSRPRLLF